MDIAEKTAVGDNSVDVTDLSSLLIILSEGQLVVNCIPEKCEASLHRHQSRNQRYPVVDPIQLLVICHECRSSTISDS
jgi:hypothetical protein